MAKNRIVNTRFWDDSYIARLSPNEKLVFLYLLTSPLTTIAGVYELPVKRASFDIGLTPKEIATILTSFEQDGKLVRHDDWIGLTNFIKHQSLNPKVREGIVAELERAPRELVAKLPIPHSLSIAYESLSHLIQSNLIKSNSNLGGEIPAQRYPHSVENEIDSLVQRMTIKK